MREDNHGYTRCVERTLCTKHDQTNSSTSVTIESIPQDVLQQIIHKVKEELHVDEQEEFKETLKMEARAEARAAVNSAFTDLMSETFTQGQAEQSTRLDFVMFVVTPPVLNNIFLFDLTLVCYSLKFSIVSLL
ncbi:hypothetical protein M9H77_35522 [Catharanthus roseus]|uniref:Uncharacterized protein n=1 Tax=Catharanthus roseus TaxID=4058 RepID=A0ACB9ZTH6_CATRO|nr:hypothetical protein M9H77_35522 [Catharanthus roseus]